MRLLVIGHHRFPPLLNTLLKRTPGETSPALGELGTTEPEAPFATAAIERGAALRAENVRHHRRRFHRHDVALLAEVEQRIALEMGRAHV